MPMKIFYSDAYNATGVKFDTTKKATPIAKAMKRLFGGRIAFVEPSPLAIAELITAHYPEYVEAVRTGLPSSSAKSNLIGWDQRLFDAVASSNGGVRDAVLEALRTGLNTGSLSSGLHHARITSGAGYCTFNGLAIAAFAALEAGANRVVILDFDAHAGGGTASIIAGRPGVEQYDVSVVMYDRYDDTANAHLVWSSGETYLEDIESVLAGIGDPSTIDVVIYNAGMDPHEQAGGVHGIDADVLAERERMVFEWAAAHDVPVAWVLAGGYTGTIDMDELVDLHCLTAEAALAAQAA